jgi:diacylglycerol kinase
VKPDLHRPFLVRLTRAFGYAAQGVGRASHDRMFRCQIVCGLAVCLMAYLMKVSAIEWMLLVLTMTVVLAMEVMNTAVEFAIDLVSPGPDPLAKLAKDAAAGAVLIASLGAFTVGVMIFGPRVWALIAS